MLYNMPNRKRAKLRISFLPVHWGQVSKHINDGVYILWEREIDREEEEKERERKEEERVREKKREREWEKE